MMCWFHYDWSFGIFWDYEMVYRNSMEERISQVSVIFFCCRVAVMVIRGYAVEHERVARKKCVWKFWSFFEVVRW